MEIVAVGAFSVERKGVLVQRNCCIAIDTFPLPLSSQTEEEKVCLNTRIQRCC